METQPHNSSAKTRTLPDVSVLPVLVYKDVIEAIGWLCKTFGFTEYWRLTDHKAVLLYGNGAIMLSDRGPHAEPGEYNSTSMTQHALMVRVSNAAAHYEHALQCGARIIQPPTDYPYGERQYEVLDPGGHFWTFSESIADLAPEEWGGFSAAADQIQGE